MKIVVIFTHPTFETSVANKAIVEELKSTLGADVEVRHLDALYPDYKINIANEQAALSKADVVVLQYPFYWYNVPAMLKLWMDQVLTYGFAYGSTGDKLQGKHLIQSFTIGGPAEAYVHGGYNNFPIEEFLPPFVQTANLTGMIYHKPIYRHGFGVMGDEELMRDEACKQALELIDAIKTI